jgi:hypothetical protein
MVGLAPGAGADDLGSPVCGLLVKSAECVPTLRNGRPGFIGSGDAGNGAACGEGNVTALRGLSLRHAKTARLFCRGL